ncbi:stage V sporulation protein AE [Ructibacterium gallinarum]|uniref:Stage V sporulation protein AE n=1 Tax=Ructibacterium gallinarum TaxID=2779355 RepID=A0A9D5M1Y3_9FIRM|nr:stage V sporulation protein AE [Ructibacterium gallinarum]MBE5039938.1 stage V sporulation protein AE [Ructibacterium gallinarum]
MQYVNAFWVGGLICAIAQVLIDKTKLTPARILVLFVVTGTVLGGLGLYDPLVRFAGAGASIPIVGFGNVLAQGVIKGVQEHGILGILTGGAEAAAGGITASIVFGFLAALIFKPKVKS